MKSLLLFLTAAILPAWAQEAPASMSPIAFKPYPEARKYYILKSLNVAAFASIQRAGSDQHHHRPGRLSATPRSPATTPTPTLPFGSLPPSPTAPPPKPATSGFQHPPPPPNTMTTATYEPDPFGRPLGLIMKTYKDGAKQEKFVKDCEGRHADVIEDLLKKKTNKIKRALDDAEASMKRNQPRNRFENNEECVDAAEEAVRNALNWIGGDVAAKMADLDKKENHNWDDRKAQLEREEKKRKRDEEKQNGW